VSTFLKIAGFIGLGVVVLLVLGVVFHLAVSLLHLVVPLAVLAGIGFAAWKIFGSKAASKGADTAPTAAPVNEALAKPALPDASPKPKPLSEEEARKQFEELRKKQPS